MVKPPTKSVSPEATPAIKPRQLNKLTKRLAKDPADEEAFVQLWDVYLEGEKWEDMAGLLEMRIPALSESREKVRALVKLAAILDEKLGDVKRSVDAYHQVLVLEPNNRRALWALGVLYHDLEDWEKVIEIYLLRINLAESLEEKLALRAQLAAIYEQRLQQEDQALMEYIRAARLAPQNVRVLLNMEKLATRTESFRELLAVYEDVVERIDRLELRIALYLKLARLYTQHLDDEDTANGYYRRALELAAGHINKLFSISTIYGEEEEWEELITTYTQLIRFAERPAVKSGLRREIARLYSHGLNDPTSAFYELVRVARYDPDQQGLVDELFTLGLEAERHLELAAVLEDVGSRLADPEVRVDLYTRLARLHLDELQNSEQARSVIARAMDLDPAHVPTQLVRFDLLQASREFEALAQALESFLSRPDLGDEVAKEQRKRLAKLYEEKLKNRERAVELYRQNLGQPAEPQAEEDREEILEQLYRRQGTWDELIKLLATRAKEATTPEAAAEVAIEIAEIYEKQLDQSDRAFFELLREIRSCPNLDRLQDELFRLGGETGFTTELSAVCQELTNSVDEQTSAELHMRLALLFENDGEPDEALENYQTALKLDPCQSVAYQKLRSRAENHFQWSDVAELDTIRAAHVKDPQEKVELLLSAAEISAEQLSDLNMATVIFGQVLKIDPQNQHAQKGLKALGQTVPGPDARAPLIDHDDEDDEPEMVTDVSTRPLIRPKADSDWNKKIDEQSSETAQEEELAEVVSLPRPPLDEMPGSETGETGEVFSPPATKPAPEPAGDDEVAEVFSPTRPPDPTAGAFPLDVGEDDYDDDSMEDREPTLVNRKPMALPDEDDEEKEPTLVTGPPPSPSTARLASTTDESIQDVLKEESLRQAEEKAQKEAKKKAKAEAKKKAKAEAKKKAEAETKKKAEAEAKKKAEQEAKKKAEAEAKKKAEAEAKKKAEKEAKKKAEAETKKKAEAEAKKKAEAEAKKKAEKEAKKKAEAETKKKAEAEAKKKAEAEAKKKAEKEAKKKAEQEAKKKAEAETKKKAEAEAKKKAEQEANKKAEEEAKKKAEQEAKKKAEQEAKKKAEEEAKKKAEEEAKKLAEEEAKKLAEEEAKKLAEEEAKKLAEEEAKKLAEEEAKKLAEEEAKKLAEEEAKKLAEEEAKKLAEEEAKKLAEKEAAQEDEPSAPAQPRDEEEETTLTEDDFEFFEEGEDEDFEEEDEGPMEEESTAPVDLVDPVITQRRIVEQKPDDVAAWEKLATLTTEHADNNKAFSVLEEGCAKLSQDDDRAQLFRRMALLSSDDELRLRLADLLREYDRLDDAESSYRAVLRSSPGSAGALDGLYGIYKIRGALERYDAILTRALNGVSEPRSRRALLLRRAQLRANRLDRLEDALTDLEQLLLADDSDLEALSLQEDIFERTERYEELVQAYEQHLPYSLTSEERVDLLCAIAIIQENQLGNQDQSLRYYRLAVEEDPTHLSSMDSLINLLERRRDWLGALKQLQLAVKAPHDPTVRSNFFFRMGKILEEQLLRPEESEEAYRQAIEGTAPSFEALQSLKQMARRRGDWVEVIHLGKRLVDITTADKERALVYCELARVWRDRLDNESESVQCYQKALECDGDNVEAGKVVAGARLRDRRHEEAHVLLARVAEQGSSDGMEAEELAIIHLKLAQTNEALDRSEDAEHSYEKALELAPGDNEILRQYGYFLARQQSWQKAVELYSTIIQEHEQDLSSDELADMHCLMAQGFDKLERQEDSAESYRKALKANDKHLPALRASIELARSLRRPRECVELMTRLRDLSPTPASRQKLSSQIGDMLHNTLHVPGEASVAYREALEYEPNNVELLEKLRRVLVHAEEYEQAVDVLEQLGHLAENDRQRARYLRIAGDIERERLDNDHRAMNLYIKALKAAPLDKRSHAAAVKILSRTRDWPRLARLYEELLRRLPPPIAGQDDRRLAILTELVELYRYRLDDGGRAIGACEQLLKIDPSQIKVREDLARLYEAEGKTSQAIKIHRLLIGDSPFSIDSYHALRRIYEAQGEADHTLCLVATLAFLDEADKDEMRMLKENRHALPIPSGRHLSEALYDRLLLHPKAGGLLGEMFSFAADFARSLFITPHKEYKLKGRDRLALDNRGDKIAEIFTRSLEFLGLPHPEIYGRGIGIKGIMAVNTSPIAVLYTEEALKRASIPELRFMVARALTFTRPENLLAASLTAKQLRTLLEALVELAFPGGPIHPVAEEVTGLARKLQRILPVRKQDRLMQLASRYREQAEDLSIRDWLEGVEHTCNRAGLAMAGDLEASVQVLKAARVVSPSGSHRALIRELIFYSISEDYFGLRKALKASI